MRVLQLFLFLTICTFSFRCEKKKTKEQNIKEKSLLINNNNETELKLANSVTTLPTLEIDPQTFENQLYLLRVRNFLETNEEKGDESLELTGVKLETLARTEMALKKRLDDARTNITHKETSIKYKKVLMDKLDKARGDIKDHSKKALSPKQMSQILQQREARKLAMINDYEVRIAVLTNTIPNLKTKLETTEDLGDRRVLENSIENVQKKLDDTEEHYKKFKSEDHRMLRPDDIMKFNTKQPIVRTIEGRTPAWMIDGLGRGNWKGGKWTPQAELSFVVPSNKFLDLIQNPEIFTEGARLPITPKDYATRLSLNEAETAKYAQGMTLIRMSGARMLAPTIRNKFVQPGEKVWVPKDPDNIGGGWMTLPEGALNPYNAEWVPGMQTKDGLPEALVKDRALYKTENRNEFSPGMEVWKTVRNNNGEWVMHKVTPLEMKAERLDAGIKTKKAKIQKELDDNGPNSKELLKLQQELKELEFEQTMAQEGFIKLP